MKVIYFSQADSRWAKTIYSAKPPHTETIKDAGCGITCAAMMVATLCDPKITPVEMADYSVKNGFRIDGCGTSANIFPALAAKYTLTHKAVKTIQEAVKMLQDGFLIVANVKGGADGLFSTGGHYILLTGIKNDGRIVVYDPFNYAGKFNTSARKGKVEINGNEIYVSKELLDADMRHDFSAYIGLKGSLNMNDYEKNIKEVQAKIGLSDETIEYLKNYKYAEALFEKLSSKI